MIVQARGTDNLRYVILGAGDSQALEDQASATAGWSREAAPAVVKPSDAAVPEPPHEALPGLASLTKAQPSPLLRWQLLEVLYAYCCSLRIFHGDWQQEPQVCSAPFGSCLQASMLRQKQLVPCWHLP